jgi:hypothetical protein
MIRTFFSIFITKMNILSTQICSVEAYVKKALYLGEMERFSHLMHVTQNRAQGTLATLTETKRRTKEMLSLNEHIEKTIQNIPASIPKTETTTNTERSGWFPWKKTTSTRISTSMVRRSLLIFA